jgi:hypothetical protein
MYKQHISWNIIHSLAKVLKFKIVCTDQRCFTKTSFPSRLEGRGFSLEYRTLWFALFPPPVLTIFGANVLLRDPPEGDPTPLLTPPC